MIAISTDDPATQAKFKASLKAPFHFVADEKGELVKLFDVKTALVNYAKRTTFVVGPGRKVLHRQDGSEAIDPTSSVTACSIRPPEALQYVTGPDGGTK